MVDLSVSHLGWESSYNDNIVKLLEENGISSIDMVLSRYFSDITSVNRQELKDLKNYWNSNGFNIRGAQSLTYGLRENLFSSKRECNQLLDHLGRILDNLSYLGAKYLVFGSPKNRYVQEDRQKEYGYYFFSKLALMSKNNGQLICLEANPVAYGCNFLTNSNDLFEFVSEIDHLGLNLDLSTLIINEVNISEDLLNLKPDYCHYSVPFLKANWDDYSSQISNFRNIMLKGEVPGAIECVFQGDDWKVLESLIKKID